MWDGFSDGKGNFSDGPYEIQYHEDFFKDTYYKFGFNPEVGSVGMPVAEPVHVQLNLASNFVEVVNTTSKELTDEEIQASVWDLDGNCPYFKVFNKVSAPPKKVVQISEFRYLRSENPKPVYFLLLKLYHVSDKTVISRNFYWLHLPGKDYTLLEPYRKKQIPLKITCNSVLVGPKYELEINVHNTSTADFAKNALQDDGKGVLVDLLQKLFGRCGVPADSNRGFKVVEMEGSDPGVAFFLRFSVHNAETEKQDTRILPVHYSDNYFSLVPGESMSFKICFAAPTGMKKSPRVMLREWSYPDGFTVFG